MPLRRVGSDRFFWPPNRRVQEQQVGKDCLETI